MWGHDTKEEKEEEEREKEKKRRRREREREKERVKINSNKKKQSNPIVCRIQLIPRRQLKSYLKKPTIVFVKLIFYSFSNRCGAQYNYYQMVVLYVLVTVVVVVVVAR